MATLKDIAQEAGISVKTVSRILNGGNKETWPSSVRRADEIRAIAKRIHFRPNATARTMRTNKTRLIGVLIRNAPDSPSNYEVILGIHHHLENAGYEMCLVHQSDMGLRSRIFREHMLDGVIVLGHMEESLIGEIRNTFRTCIWVDVNVDEPTRCVHRDEFQAGSLVGRAVAERGYQQVMWLGDRPEKPGLHYSQIQRLAGLRQGLGPQLDSRLEIYPVAVKTHAQFFQRIKQIAPKTALVLYNMPQTQVVLEMLAQRRLLPGVDVGIVCPDSSDFISSRISRVSFDRIQMGKEAAQLLLDQLQEMQSPSVLLSGQWIEGWSLPFL